MAISTMPGSRQCFHSTSCLKSLGNVKYHNVFLKETSLSVYTPSLVKLPYKIAQGLKIFYADDILIMIKCVLCNVKKCVTPSELIFRYIELHS